MLYAHSAKNGDKQNRSSWQPLRDHLEQVARLASEFAESTHACNWAYTVGILHDIGKADQRFQRRLEGSKKPFSHSTAGAEYARRMYSNNGNIEGDVLVPLILGHHGGLPNYRGSIRVSSVVERFESIDDETLKACKPLSSLLPVEDDSPARSLVQTALHLGENPYVSFPWLLFVVSRMLFSSLVDADWLDTERVMNPDVYQLRQSAIAKHCTMGELLKRFDNRICMRFDHIEPTPINDAREAMRKEAVQKADLPVGLYELEMPTGGGKTITSLEFALHHAVKNRLERIIYAIPFMSIVEQNAKVFKDLLGNDNVLEHYSGYDFGYKLASSDLGGDSEDDVATYERTLVQNWDAPVVVTTNVQLFESLFTNKVARSRKVHNVASSVIVLDEVQTLPETLLKPTLAMLESLVKVANVSVVLCTATQPSLEKCWPFHATPTKLIENPATYDSLFGARVSIHTEHASVEKSFSLGELVSKLSGLHQVLCVVSTRRAARMIYDAILDYASGEEGIEEEGEAIDSEGVFHLSALMVPEHRTAVLNRIRVRLRRGLSCQVVSTQLIEAGVDIDFPVVYREVAGIDSVLQASGRCNREGRLESQGHVHVFCCADFPQGAKGGDGWLAQTRELGLESLRFAERSGCDPFGRESVSRYFKRLHQTTNRGIDGRGVYRMLDGATDQWKQLSRGRFPYETIAEQYKFIADDSVSLFVPWGDAGSKLLDRIERGTFDYGALPLVHRLSLSIPLWLFRQYDELCLVRRVKGFPLAILETRSGFGSYYDDVRGLLAPGEVVPEVLVI